MQEQNSSNKVDRNKVYFLIIVIAALIGINGYLYFKDKEQSSRFVTVSTEKDRLKLEVEKIEVELDKVNSLNLNLGEKLEAEQLTARNKIEELKIALQKGKLTQSDLDKAQKEIKELRDFVRNYNDQIIRLEKENSYLKTERDSLKTTSDKYSQKADSYSQKAENLEKENENLSAKVKVGAALKASNITINAYKVKSSGKNTLVTRANTADKLLVNFSIAPNSLAEKGYHTVYLRVFDPAGNLIINKEDDLFEADGQKMQFSSKIQFNYNDDNSSFDIDWINPKTFSKGVYTTILYADGFMMGKSQITLR